MFLSVTLRRTFQVKSVEDEKAKFDEEDKLDGERLDRLRKQGEIELEHYESLEKEREKLLEEAEQRRYLAVKTAHLKEETKLNELKDELESKKSKRYEDLARHADESARMLALVLDERQAMRNAAEKHWKEAQEEVDKENDDLRKAVREANETIEHCVKEGERYLREQEEDLVPLRAAIEDAVEAEKTSKENHSAAMEEARSRREATKDERDTRVADLAKFEKESEEENLQRATDIEDSQKKINNLIREKHAAVDSKYALMRTEMAALEKEELGSIAIEKRACELTLKDLEQFHLHEANRIDDLMTVVEDFEDLVSQCQKSSENERDSIEKEWGMALLSNQKEIEDLEQKIKLKHAGLKKAEAAARKALDQELARLDQTVSHAKAEQLSKTALVTREIEMRKKEIQEIDQEMREILTKERLLGERKAEDLSDHQIKFLRPRTTEQIMTPTKAQKVGLPMKSIAGNQGPVNAEHHAAADLCDKLKEFYESGSRAAQLPAVPEGAEAKDQDAPTVPGPPEPASEEKGEEAPAAEVPTAEEDDPLSFTKEIERLSEADAIMREIEIVGDAPPTLNDCLNQGGRYSELSRRKVRLLVEVKAKEEEIQLDEDHVARVERRIERQKRLRISALNEMLGIQLEELEDERETKVQMVAQRRERLHASRKAYISKHAKCQAMLDNLSDACLPSLTHLREYSNEQSSGWGSAEREALADLRKVQILEKETAEHFALKKDQLQVSEREEHEQCERDMVDAREHLARKRVDLIDFNQKVVEERERRNTEIESLTESMAEQDKVMEQMEAQRVDDEQVSIDLIASLHSKINNVYNIRKDLMKENEELKLKTEEKLPFFENNLAANEERILSEQAEYERKIRDAEAHREEGLKNKEKEKDEIEKEWKDYSTGFEKQCSLAREQAKSAIASAQMTFEADCTSEAIKKLKEDADEALHMSEQHRIDASKAQETREHRRVLQFERWRRFLEACEQEKIDLNNELDSEEQQLKVDYDGYFADLEEEEVAARAELESNEQKAKDENHVRYRQERELEVFVEKLSEAARECRNSKHQQERTITEKEKALALVKDTKEEAEGKRTDHDLDQKRCANLLERLIQRIAKEVTEHDDLLLKERTDFESQLSLALESAKLEADAKLQRMQVEAEEENERLQKEFQVFTEKRKTKLDKDKLELQDEVRVAREALEVDLKKVDKASYERGRDREREQEFAVRKRKVEREHNQRKFNEIVSHLRSLSRRTILSLTRANYPFPSVFRCVTFMLSFTTSQELKYDAFVDNQIADIEAYFDLVGERLEKHGQNVLRQQKLERQRAEDVLKSRMNTQLEENQKRVQQELEMNRRKMQEETQKMLEEAETELWIRLKEERAARLAMIDQKRSQMKKSIEEEYISAQVKIREELAQAEKDKMENVLSVFGQDSVKRGELALRRKLEKDSRPSSRDDGLKPKVKAETEAFSKERAELIKDMALMDLELQELEAES